MKTGGRFSDGGNWADINASLVGTSAVRLLGIDPGDPPTPDVNINPPGSLRHPNLVNTFTAKPENVAGVRWDAIHAIDLGIHPNGDSSDVSFKFIKVIGHELTGETTELLFQN